MTMNMTDRETDIIVAALNRSRNHFKSLEEKDPVVIHHVIELDNIINKIRGY